MTRTAKQQPKRPTSPFALIMSMAIVAAIGAAGGYAYARATASEILLSQDGSTMYRVNAKGDVDYLPIGFFMVTESIPGWTPVNIDKDSSFDLFGQPSKRTGSIGQAGALRK